MEQSPLVDNRVVPLALKKASKPVAKLDIQPQTNAVIKKTKTKYGTKTSVLMKKPKTSRLISAIEQLIKPPTEPLKTHLQKIVEKNINEEPGEKATNVENTSDPTNIDKLEMGDNLGKNESVQVPGQYLDVSNRKEVQEPNTREKPRKPVEAPLEYDSVEAAAAYYELVAHDQSRSDLYAEPRVILNKVHMDLQDNDRKMNSMLDQFEIFNENSVKRKVKEEIKPTQIRVAPNKEYINQENNQEIGGVKKGFHADLINVFNNPFESHMFAQHLQSSKLGGFYLA